MVPELPGTIGWVVSEMQPGPHPVGARVLAHSFVVAF